MTLTQARPSLPSTAYGNQIVATISRSKQFQFDRKNTQGRDSHPRILSAISTVNTQEMACVTATRAKSKSIENGFYNKVTTVVFSTGAAAKKGP